MKILNCLFFLFFIITIAKAQNTRFVTEGKIEFERKVNLHAQFTGDDSWTDEFKKRIPQFKTTYFNLIFNNNKSIYQPGREIAENNKLWEQPAEDNVIYTELDKKWAISQKRIFEKTS